MMVIIGMLQPVVKRGDVLDSWCSTNVSYVDMAKLSDEEVRHVAQLANLSLTDDQLSKFKDQLSNVIDYVNQLEEVDTKDSQPTSQTTGLVNVTRDDEISPQQSLSQDQALSGTEETHSGYFVVPALLDEKKE